MRIPDPTGLRCPHPCLPTPRVGGRRLELKEEPARSSRPRRESERLRVAAQLLALTSLLAELDLWPGRAALRRAIVVDSPDGPTARVSAFPTPLTAVSRRIGGGEAGAVALRSAALTAVREAAGLSVAQLPGPSVEPGPFLHHELARVLDRLPSPLDAATARSLWMMCLPRLQEPLDGEVVLCEVADGMLADRLAAAAWSSLERARRRCWVWRVGADQDTGPLPTPDARGVLLAVGSLGAAELAAAERWAARPGCAAMAVGRFPRGWSPPRPGSCGAPWRLVLAGIGRDRARVEAERWMTRVEPTDPDTARMLTERARTRFAAPAAGVEQPATADRDDDDVRTILGLLPEGLPPGFLTLNAAGLMARLGTGQATGALFQDGRWRLTDPRPLTRHPLHREVAALFAPGDPRRLRHLALGDGDTRGLLTWVTARLDALEVDPVCEILQVVAPGALGDEIDLALAEACLWRQDVTGARSAMARVPARRRAPLELWIEAVDTVPGCPIARPDPRHAAVAPRAVAVTAAMALVRATRRSDRDISDEVRARLDEVGPRLAPVVARWVEVQRAAADRPQLLGDRAWRRRITAGHPVLTREVLHRSGLVAAAQGRPRSACRLLERARSLAAEPGLRGRIELDLGAAVALSGSSERAEVHQQRAFMLLQAAGFRRLPSSPLGNLAMSDLDNLRLERAEARLHELLARHDDPYSRAELVRLELARGHLDRAGELLRELPIPDAAGGANLVEALHLLHGALGALDGDVVAARRHLELGGSEGRCWLALLDAVEGLSADLEGDDGWGIRLAARWVSSGSPPPATAAPAEPTGRRLALAAAIADRIAGHRIRLANRERRRHAVRLDDLGATGWAQSLRAGVTADAEWLAAAARLAEVRSLAGLTAAEAETLVAGLGVSGLEVWSEDRRSRLAGIGEGAAAAEGRAGRLRVVPLGGDLVEDPTWRLVRALLDPSAGPEVVEKRADDPQVAATGLCGRSGALVELRTEIARLAPMRMTVLLLGETGVGKEVAARALHRLSGRRGRFVAVNVAAIPETLLEAELFGSVRGAFTGADRDRKGLAEAAEGGTLFLDEIGDLGLALQAKLLRFLESFEVRPVGSDRTRAVDVRVVAATHRDLAGRVQEGSFRSDLYYRISAAPIEIPPLRARREDILELRDMFQLQIEEREGMPPLRWSREAEAALLAHGWPGNVRELRHVVEVARVRARGPVVEADDLALHQPGARAAPARRWDEALDAFRRNLLREALGRNSGNRSATARELGISRQALLYHLRTLDVEGPSRAGKKGAGHGARRRKEEV